MLPVADGFSVIHAGVLMPVAQAWVEMMQEFPQHGFTEERIRLTLQRATESHSEVPQRDFSSPGE